MMERNHAYAWLNKSDRANACAYFGLYAYTHLQSLRVLCIWSLDVAQVKESILATWNINVVACWDSDRSAVK